MRKSKLIDTAGPIHFDLANQSKFLPGVHVRIKLVRIKDAFSLISLMCNEDKFKIAIWSASLYVRKVNVVPSIIIDHERAIEVRVGKLPIRRVEVKSFALAAGIRSTTIANAFIGQLPYIV